MVFTKFHTKVKKYLRHSQLTSGRTIRGELWKDICRDVDDNETQRVAYRKMSLEFNGSSDVKKRSLSSSSESNVSQISDTDLTDSGKTTLVRLLSVVEQTRPDFSCIPVLSPLATVFLNYMHEEEAFVCLMKLLSTCQKFLYQTDVCTMATKLTMVALTKQHANAAYLHFRKLTGFVDDIDMTPIFEEWKHWIFRDLPFSYLACIIDCFIQEGQKILFRIVLAVLKLWYKEKCSTNHNFSVQPNKETCRQLGDKIKDFCKNIPVPPHKLLKAAFSIPHLSMNGIQRLYQENESLLEAMPKLSRNVSCSSLGIYQSKGSSILSPKQLKTLCQFIPLRYRIKSLMRLYSLNEDGTSFTNFWSKIEYYSPTILIIRTSSDEVFGAYCSDAWSTRRHSSHLTYFGTGETFLFKYDPTLTVYPWVGLSKPRIEHGEDFFQAANFLTLLIGGGAISIRNSLTSGSSEASPTFDSRRLSVETDFEIASLELFGLTDNEE